MRSTHDLYLVTINPLVSIHVYPPTPLPLECSIGIRLGYARPYAQPNTLVFSKLHCLCTILAQSFLLRFVEEEEKKYEQKIGFKGDGNERYVNGFKVFAYIFDC